MPVSVKQYSLYIFDLDGTLVDSSQAELRCYAATLGRLGYVYREADLPQLPRQSFRATYELYDPHGEKHTFQEFVRTLLEEAGRFQSEAAVPFPDTARTVAELVDDGFSLCVATRMTSIRAKRLLKQYDLLRFFDHVIGSDSVQHPKPDPECIMKCLSYYSISLEQAVMVGDTPNDMLAAQRAGVTGILIDRSGREEHVPCTARIRTLTELL